jgi:hypothetical protein
MSEAPGYLTTLDYARRWGIEPMFSDFKTRGFGLEDSQIRYPDRLARLILVMALALYLGLVEDTRENHPQADAASYLDGVRKCLPSWTRERSRYPVENAWFSGCRWLNLFRTPRPTADAKVRVQRHSGPAAIH